MMGGSGSVIYKRKSSCTHSTDHTHNIKYSLCRSLLRCIRAIRKLLSAIKQLYKNVISLVDSGESDRDRPTNDDADVIVTGKLILR